MKHRPARWTSTSSCPTNFLPSSILVIDVKYSCVCAGWQRAIQPLISRVDVSLLHGLEHPLGAVAPLHCARQPIGSSPAHCFCALPAGAGVSSCGSNGGCNPFYTEKSPEYHRFQSPTASLVWRCTHFIIQKRHPAEDICIKLPMTQRLWKRCLIKTTCVHSFRLQYSHFQQQHTHTHTATEGRKHLRAPI